MDPLETNCILPEDVFRDILSLLPVRDLLRFRCVSKSWCALIDDPTFIQTHYNAQYAAHKEHGDLPFLLWRNLSTIERVYPIQCHLLSKQHGDDTVLNLTSDLERFTNSIFPNIDPSYINFRVFCRGSANGIICLQFQGLDIEKLGRDFSCCGLWNPASRELKIVAFPHVPDECMPRRLGFTVVAFGFDPRSNDFKIVANTIVASDIVFLYMVYSLRTDSWKRVCEPSIHGDSANVWRPERDACFKGVHYWTAYPLDGEYDHIIFRILSYNFSTEVFRFSDPPQGALPPVIQMYDELTWNIGLYNESIALFFIRKAGEASVEASVDIWVVTEFKDDDFGVPLAWQCLISIKPIIERLGSWFGAQQIGGDLLFEMSDSELSLYNPTTSQFRRMGISFNICFRYVQSLFPLLRRVVLLT